MGFINTKNIILNQLNNSQKTKEEIVEKNTSSKFAAWVPKQI